MIRDIFGFQIVKIGLLCIGCVLPLMAQGAPNLKEKYENLSTTEIYTIRPEVTASVKYGEKRKIKEIIIENALALSFQNCSKDEATNSIDDNLINEIILPMKLDNPIFSFQLATSANNMSSMEMHLNLSVTKWFAYAHCRKDFTTYRRVVIKFDPVIVKSIKADVK